MLYSFNLIKKILPQIGKIDKNRIIEALNQRTAEAKIINKNSFELILPANRCSDLGSHLGIVQELSAILCLKRRKPSKKIKAPASLPNSPQFLQIEIQDKKVCPRYLGFYFENIKIKPSPKWMQKILSDCKLRPINNVVDIVNYVMLVTGQPLHAFDFDKIENKKLVVRFAKNGEKIITLDNERHELDKNTLIIADSKEPLAIAGIKGGKKAEVDKETKRIVIESASFARALIYKTSKKIGLNTDASLRFSHQLSYFLPEIGMVWAQKLLEKIGAEPKMFIDVKTSAISAKKIVGISIKNFKKLLGFSLPINKIKFILESLGFQVKIRVNSQLAVEVPIERVDIENWQDLAEEAMRVFGLENVPLIAPCFLIKPIETEEIILFKEKIRDVLVNLCFDEVYNSSFVEEGGKGQVSIELENPVSQQYRYLRPNLIQGLISNLEKNLRNFQEIKIFEIGKVFTPQAEHWSLGMAMAGSQETFFRLKGIVENFLKAMGLNDLFLPAEDLFEGVKIKNDSQTLGFIIRRNNFSLAEINLEKLLNLIKGEIFFTPLPKYPSVTRDLSILVKKEQKIGELIQLIQETNLKNIADVDFIGEHPIGQKTSLTFRIIFQIKNRTLTSKEVDGFMKQIERKLKFLISNS